MKTNTRVVCCIIAIAAAATLGACGSSGGAASGSSTTTSSSSSDAVPTDVVIASPTASTSGSSSDVSVGKGLKATALPGDASSSSYSDKKAAREALEAGTGTCGFTPSLTMPSVVQCYGPQLTYANHPDGSPSSGTLPPFDTGFWNLTEGASGQACAAAQVNSLIDAVSTRVDMMFNMFDMMVCVGKKAGLSLPAVGATTDYKTSMSANGSVSGITVNTATIERLANSSAGNPVYKSTINITISVGGMSRTGTAILKNEVTGTDASGKNNYKGKLSMTMSNPTAIGNNCGSNAPDSGSVMAGVVKYVKSSATSVKYEMNYAEFCGTTASPLDSSNNISRTNVFSQTATTSTNSGASKTGWGSNWNYGIFDLNPSNGTGSVAYAWQAGYNDQRTRVMDITVSQASDGSASGTAWYGFGPDVNGSETLGSIDGFICNWTGPNGATSVPGNNRSQATLAALSPPRAVSKSQKQKLTRANGATVYTTTAANSNITYAVDNSCDKVSNNATFTFQSSAGTMTNDVTGSGLVTNNLVAIPSSTDFPMPSTVDDVGS